MQQDHMRADYPQQQSNVTMCAPINPVPMEFHHAQPLPAVIDEAATNTSSIATEPTSLAPAPSRSSSVSPGKVGPDIFVQDKAAPDKFILETRLIELGAALSAAQQLFKELERDFYLATFGRYDD